MYLKCANTYSAAQLESQRCRSRRSSHVLYFARSWCYHRCFHPLRSASTGKSLDIEKRSRGPVRRQRTGSHTTAAHRLTVSRMFDGSSSSSQHEVYTRRKGQSGPWSSRSCDPPFRSNLLILAKAPTTSRDQVSGLTATT
jgi:hypothetical protein